MSSSVEEIARLKAKMDSTKPHSQARHRARLDLSRALHDDMTKVVQSKTRRREIKRILAGQA